ncbi:energy-coupling factor transporter transmembrane component T [Anaerolentibacter hominis]|uniref:energy-coupling factor transporter transmembrane component T family protein n=1 Tax=Anaerolentibacter hominis TaxID=3079009 RepID=UPI0031B832E3
MIRDITIGQYYPADSVIHRLDPRMKLLGTFVFIISLFLFKSFSGYIVAAVFLFSVIKISRVPFGFIFRGLKVVLLLLIFMAFFNLFFTPGTPVFQWWIIKITKEGIRNACFMAIRLTFLIVGSSLMTFTTTPNQLTDGLERVLRPLSKIGVPAHEIAMMMSIALRFIPILLEETDKIMKAQQARGADFESGGLIAKAKSLVPILVPLFISAFRRADELAMAMEARCYHGGEGRTKMKPLHYEKRDYITLAVLVLYMIAVIAVGRGIYL